MHPLRRRRKKAGINILPLLDVLTVIIFFFLITMQFRHLRTLNLTLPEIKTAGSNVMTEKMVISVDSEGQLFFNNTLVEEEQFADILANAGALSRSRHVLLLADEETPLRRITWIMDLCRSNGLEKIRIQSR